MTPAEFDQIGQMYFDFARGFVTAAGRAPEGKVWVATVDLLGRPGPLPKLVVEPRSWDDLTECKPKELTLARQAAASLPVPALVVLHRCGSCPEWHVLIGGIVERRAPGAVPS